MTAVYVACPLGDRTGGPEALTLLVHSLRRRGVESYLIPMRNFRGRRVHPEYAYLTYEVVERIPRRSDAHFVLTEVSPIESRRELSQVPDEHIWMLWLSVNFSPLPAARYYRASEATGSMYPPGTQGRSLPTFWPFDDEPISDGAFTTLREGARRSGGWTIRHWRRLAVEGASIAYAQHVVSRNINFGTQSYYGRGFVRSVLGADAFLLTDYPRIPSIVSTGRRRNRVAYNGKKGRWKIHELQRLLPDVEFLPLENMTYQEVAEALASSALYVEIGHLPGRDRLPREAANLGTPTVLLARGAGYCWDDFPLGERYRIPYTVDWASQMAPVIREVLADPTEIHETQMSFREWVAEEPYRYEQALDQWVERLTTT